MAARRGLSRLCLRPLRIMGVAAVALLAAGCAQTATAVGNSHMVVARDNSNGKTVRVSVGDRLELILASSYWNVDSSTSPAVLRQDGPTTFLAPPSDCSTMPGSGAPRNRRLIPHWHRARW